MTWLKRHHLSLFFVLAFILAWWPWPLTRMNPNSVAMIPWSPILAAFIVLALTKGWAGVKGLLKDMARWRVSIKWYAFAFLVPLLVTVVAVYLNTLLGAPAPTAAHYTNWTSIFATFLTITLIQGPLTEEPGWRGFALPRFLGKYTPLVSSLILGLIWFSWHLPLLLTDDSGGQRPPLPYFFLLLALSVIFAWVYIETKRSVFLVILMHGAVNTFLSFFAPVQFEVGYISLWWIIVSLWWVVALYAAYRMATIPIPQMEVDLPTPDQTAAPG